MDAARGARGIRLLAFRHGRLFRFGHTLTLPGPSIGALAAVRLTGGFFILRRGWNSIEES
jgi:hypothetical protein